MEEKPPADQIENFRAMKRGHEQTDILRYRIKKL